MSRHKNAVPEQVLAATKADIGALLDKLGRDAKTSTCAATLAGIRSALKELVAGQMYHMFDGDEAATHEAIEENLELLRKSHRIPVHGANGQATTVSIPPRES